MEMDLSEWNKIGDGSYAVYIQKEDTGAFGNRVAAMMIVFIGDESEDEDEAEVCEECGDEMWGFNNGVVCPSCETKDEEADDESTLESV